MYVHLHTPAQHTSNNLKLISCIILLLQYITQHDKTKSSVGIVQQQAEERGESVPSPRTLSKCAFTALEPEAQSKNHGGGKFQLQGPKAQQQAHAGLALSFFSALARKSLLNQTLATFFVILVTYVLFNAFFRPTDSSTLDTTFPFNSATATSSVVLAANDVSAAGSSPSVKVFLHDLPRRFTYGVIAGHSAARGCRSFSDDDYISSFKYPGHQHMAEWYLFTDLNRPETERIGSPVTRVMDPDEPDLFYVPFFSSESDRKHGPTLRRVRPGLQRRREPGGAGGVVGGAGALEEEQWEGPRDNRFGSECAASGYGSGQEQRTVGFGFREVEA